MLSIAISQQRLEADLASGTLLCPGCSGRLSPWGFARLREVRMLDEVRSVRPRRACCRSCGATHVLSPSWSVPRRRDGAEVIGEALWRAARGEGHRRIARRLGRPPGTVRGWLRAARARAESLRACGVRWAYALDRELGAVTPAGSELGDAVEAIMLAVRARVLRFGHGQTGPWERAVWLTGGLCPAGRPSRRSRLARSCASTTSSPSSCTRRLRVKRRSNARMLAASAARRLTPDDGAATPQPGL